MNYNLLIVGENREAGTAREIAEAAWREISQEKPEQRKVKLQIAAQETQKKWEQLAVEYPFAAVVLTDPKKRLDLMFHLETYCYTIATLIHPESAVSPSASIGKGSIIHPMSTIGAGAVLGAGVWVKSGAVVEGDCLIGDACLLESGAIVKAGSIVPPGTTVKSGEIFHKNLFCEHTFFKNVEEVKEQTEAEYYFFEAGM